MPQKPVRLRPLDPKQKAAFWVGIGLAALLIIVGWAITIRGLVTDGVPFIKDEFQGAIEVAADALMEIESETEGARSQKDEIQLMMQIYGSILSGEPLDEALVEELEARSNDAAQTESANENEEYYATQEHE